MPARLVFVDGSAPTGDEGAAEPAPPRPESEWTEPSNDERETGWGEDTAGRGRDDDWYESERPPHH